MPKEGIRPPEARLATINAAITRVSAIRTGLGNEIKKSNGINIDVHAPEVANDLIATRVATRQIVKVRRSITEIALPFLENKKRALEKEFDEKDLEQCRQDYEAGYLTEDEFNIYKAAFNRKYTQIEQTPQAKEEDAFVAAPPDAFEQPAPTGFEPPPAAEPEPNEPEATPAPPTPEQREAIGPNVQINFRTREIATADRVARFGNRFGINWLVFLHMAKNPYKKFSSEEISQLATQFSGQESSRSTGTGTIFSIRRIIEKDPEHPEILVSHRTGRSVDYSLESSCQFTEKADVIVSPDDFKIQLEGQIIDLTPVEWKEITALATFQNNEASKRDLSAAAFQFPNEFRAVSGGYHGLSRKLNLPHLPTIISMERRDRNIDWISLKNVTITIGEFIEPRRARPRPAPTPSPSPGEGPSDEKANPPGREPGEDSERELKINEEQSALLVTLLSLLSDDAAEYGFQSLNEVDAKSYVDLYKDKLPQNEGQLTDTIFELLEVLNKAKENGYENPLYNLANDDNLRLLLLEFTAENASKAAEMILDNIGDPIAWEIISELVLAQWQDWAQPAIEDEQIEKPAAPETEKLKARLKENAKVETGDPQVRQQVRNTLIELEEMGLREPATGSRVTREINYLTRTALQSMVENGIASPENRGARAESQIFSPADIVVMIYYHRRNRNLNKRQLKGLRKIVEEEITNWETAGK